MNGYKNWETYVFVLHYEDYLLEMCQEEEVNNIIDVLEYIEDILVGIRYRSGGDGFIDDILSATTAEIDRMSIAENIFNELKNQ